MHLTIHKTSVATYNKATEQRGKMNKHIKQYCEEKGLTVDGNTAYGTLNGFETNFKLDNLDNYNPLKFHINCYTTDEQKRNIESELRKKAFKFFRWQFTRYGIFIGVNYFTNKSAAKRLPSLMDETIEVLKSNGALGTGYCPICGKELTADANRPYSIDEIYRLKVTADDECVNDVNKVIEAENVDYNNAPNNYAQGFLGALLGGLAGALIAIVLSFAGYVATISSLVACGFGSFLYVKFGGKRNKMMIVIVTITSLICVVSSMFVIYIILSAQAAKEAGLIMTGLEAFTYLMNNVEEFKKAFFSDLAMSILFAVVGVILEIAVEVRKLKRPGKIK